MVLLCCFRVLGAKTFCRQLKKYYKYTLSGFFFQRQQEENLVIPYNLWRLTIECFESIVNVNKPTKTLGIKEE